MAIRLSPKARATPRMPTAEPLVEGPPVAKIAVPGPPITRTAVPMPSASTTRVVWFMQSRSISIGQSPGRPRDGRSHAMSPARSRSGTLDHRYRRRMSDTPSHATCSSTASTSAKGPRWHDGRLWYSDFYQRAIYSVTTDGDRTVEFGDLDDRPSGLGWMPDGSLLAVAMTSAVGAGAKLDGATRACTPISATIATGHCNDMVVDAAGQRLRRQLRVRLRDPRCRVRAGRPRARAGRRIGRGRRRPAWRSRTVR